MQPMKSSRQSPRTYLKKWYNRRTVMDQNQGGTQQIDVSKPQGALAYLAALAGKVPLEFQEGEYRRIAMQTLATAIAPPALSGVPSSDAPSEPDPAPPTYDEDGEEIECEEDLEDDDDLLITAEHVSRAKKLIAQAPKRLYAEHQQDSVH